MAQLGFFDEDERKEKLSKLGDSLERLDKVVDWKSFKPILEKAFRKESKGPGGRPPYDYIMMFKILILQRIYNLSDEQTEFQINDRITFMRFLGLTMSDRIPDAKTIWNFRNELVEKKVIEKLFAKFNRSLESQGIIKKEGVIVDATFVDAPRQRNTPDENESIKNDEMPEGWDNQDEKTVHKIRQKDTDARWTKKRDETHYGYKDHVKADIKSKLITGYTVTSAAVHDSNELKNLVKKNDGKVYADSAYVGKGKELPEDVELIVCEKGYRNHPLTEEQKKNNRMKSRTRCRIEHIFGFITVSMKGLTLRCIGKARAEFNIGLTNLIYNMFRYETIKRCGL